MISPKVTKTDLLRKSASTLAHSCKCYYQYTFLFEFVLKLASIAVCQYG